MSLLSIIKAYAQSPRTWNYLASVLPILLEGNKWGLTNEMIAIIITIASGFFGVSMSIRPPRLLETKTDAA